MVAEWRVCLEPWLMIPQILCVYWPGDPDVEQFLYEKHEADEGGNTTLTTLFLLNAGKFTSNEANAFRMFTSRIRLRRWPAPMAPMAVTRAAEGLALSRPADALPALIEAGLQYPWRATEIGQFRAPRRFASYALCRLPTRHGWPGYTQRTKQGAKSRRGGCMGFRGPTDVQAGHPRTGDELRRRRHQEGRRGLGHDLGGTGNLACARLSGLGVDRRREAIVRNWCAAMEGFKQIVFTATLAHSQSMATGPADAPSRWSWNRPGGQPIADGRSL